MDDATPKVWKVGELARETGLSVRALHYYDEIGLLSPSRRTDSGARIYSSDDIVRLQRIQSLKYLGFGLEEIKECLERPDSPLRRTIQLHASRLRERMQAQRRLLDRLELIQRRMDPVEEVPIEEFTRMILEVIMMSEKLNKYYTSEQLEELKQRKRDLGERRIREVEAEWPRLMREVRAEMEDGTDPTDERVQRLANRWMALVREFTGGNPEIASSLNNVWNGEENIHGIEAAPMREMMEYISRASADPDTVR